MAMGPGLPPPHWASVLASEQQQAVVFVDEVIPRSLPDLIVYGVKLRFRVKLCRKKSLVLQRVAYGGDSRTKLCTPYPAFSCLPVFL